MERSLTIFLNHWTPRGIFLPFTKVLVDWNLKYSYGPINDFLTSVVAPHVPGVLTPNAITLVSTAMLMPVLFLLSRHYFVLAALLVFVHDMADRLDGSVARWRQKQGSKFPPHDGHFGAFLDAQGDKVFHIGFLLANLMWNYTSIPYKLVAVSVIVAQSVSFVVRCLDFFIPTKESAPDLRAGGEGKLATTLCNLAALTACLAARDQIHGNIWGALSVALLIVSLDLALRSVKSKLVLRVLHGEKPTTPESTDELFVIAQTMMNLHRFLSLSWLARYLVKRLQPPGMAKFLGMHTALVFQVQGALMLLCIPFLYCVKHDMVAAGLVIIFVFNASMEMVAEVALHHWNTKSITYYLYNQSQFVEYLCLRVFGLICLWSQWTRMGANWGFLEFSFISLLLAAHFLYTLALLIIRFDDTMPQHPSHVASWARLGGPGSASGRNSLGVLRERVRPWAMAFMSILLGVQRVPGGPEAWNTWYGVGAIVTFLVTLSINHIDLMHKIKVRSVSHQLSRESLNTLAPQDESLKEDRSANPPKYDVVVTIGCFDLFHEGHIKLMQRMRSFGTRLIVGLHDDESINLLKGRFPVDNVVKRLRNVKRYADVAFVIPSTDPSPYLDAAVDRSIPKDRMCFIRGDDMPQFPGRPIAEQLMQIHLTPYMEGVSSTMLRAKLTERVEGDADALSGGIWIFFQNEWQNTAALPPGTGWICYGVDYFRYRVTDISPTIQ